MKTVRRYVGYTSRADVFTIWYLADLHIGSKATALDVLKADIETIKNDPCAFWIGGGDYAEYISYTDRRRFDPANFPLDIAVADLGNLGVVLTGRVAELLKPIAHKCLAILYGNHEEAYMRDKDQSGLHGWLCTELKTADLGYGGWLDLNFVRHTEYQQPRIISERPAAAMSSTRFRMFAHHGAGAAQTPGGRITRLDRFMDDFNAEIYFIGHVHGKTGYRRVRLEPDDTCSKVIAKEQLGVISGSYLKTYQQDCVTYGEKKAYRPALLGAAFVQLRPETGHSGEGGKQMRAEI